MSTNDVKVSGGLTRDPDAGYGKDSGTPYWRATLAVNGARYDSQARAQVVKTTFVSVVAFGSKAEQLLNSGVGKGDELWVAGELDQSAYEKDGKTEHKTHVTVSRFDVIRQRLKRAAPAAQQQGGWSAPDAEDPWGSVPPNDSEPPF